jgi:hypothetical protein
MPWGTDLTVKNTIKTAKTKNAKAKPPIEPPDFFYIKLYR